jgi:hypothetical protein
MRRGVDLLEAPPRESSFFFSSSPVRVVNRRPLPKRPECGARTLLLLLTMLTLLLLTMLTLLLLTMLLLATVHDGNRQSLCVKRAVPLVKLIR